MIDVMAAMKARHDGI